MPTNESQISVVLSGGSNNSNQNASLGGDPSVFSITSGSLNNLFDNISPEESRDGHEDYRCIYFFNDGDDIIHLVKVWIYEDNPTGSTMELGIESRDDSQRFTINGAVNGGSFNLSYKNRPFTVEYNSDLATWSNELRLKLLELTDVNGDEIFRNINVTAQNAGPNVIIFDVLFFDKDGKKNHEELVVSDNELTPLGNVSIVVSKTLIGSPINTVAPEINQETTPPGGVSFFVPSAQSPIELPKLLPTEGFPIWIKRVTETGSEAVENDNFVMRFSAQSREPS